MSDGDDDKVKSLADEQRKRAHAKLMERLKPARDAMIKIFGGRKQQVEFLAQAFGLDKGYNKRVLYCLLDASLEIDEAPPFKLYTDIGWLYRGFLLANGQTYNRMAWIPSAQAIAKAYAEFDDLTERRYADCQTLFSVPDHVHSEILAIVDGLMMFSEWRGREKLKVNCYHCLVSAIVTACDGAADEE